MTPGITPLYAATRSALLDALEALAGRHGPGAPAADCYQG
jgi:hypothetical protein